MKQLLTNLRFQIHSNLFLKDPESSELGKNIVKKSIELIDEQGFESFTFKKLGKQIESNESSIYRYFENKHKLLLYLSSWFWGWKEYQLVFETNSMPNPKDKLLKAIEVITQEVKEDFRFAFVDETALFRIMISEFSKSYLTKEIDVENKEGYFELYKRIHHRLTELILLCNSNYLHAKSLSSAIIEGSLQQHYFRFHFPSLTDCEKGAAPTEFYQKLVIDVLKL